MHYQKFLETNKLNLRKTWEGIREVINIKKTKVQIGNALNNSEDVTNENNKIAEKFGSHFCRIADTIENNIPKAKNQFSDYLKNQMEQSFLSIPQHLTKLSAKSNI